MNSSNLDLIEVGAVFLGWKAPKYCPRIMTGKLVGIDTHVNDDKLHKSPV